uniref:Uncharacterized protein n=1 Tax=Anopheles dirus TaxID=7168 RepID=A0A182NGW3_9DIPT
MDRWIGKVAVVTGASSGIGAEIAKDLAKAGMITIGLARRVERVEQLKKEVPAEVAARLHAMKCDVSVERDIETTFQLIRDTYGGVDVLVNNAGIVRPQNLIELGHTADLRAVLDTNVTGLVLCSQWAYQSMVQRKVDGHIVHINSIAGHSVPNFPKVSIYPASKHAVTAITETMRQELRAAGTKIKVTCVSPLIVSVLLIITMKRWIGKVAVVTGASSGIGATIAKDLAKAGMITIGLAPGVERVEHLKQKVPAKASSRLHAIKCDVTSESDIESTFQRIRDSYGGVDVLVNNAGILRSKHLIELGTAADLRAVLDTNVTGLVLCSQWAYQSMVQRKVDGHIVHINSIAGHSVPNFPKVSIYPASKHAVTAITETMRQELRAAGTKIKVTVAVVTGASSGIGAEIAKDLAKAGMITIGLARRVERVQQLKKEVPAEAAARLHAMKCDVSIESDIETTFQRIRDTYGGVDVLVNNAGIVRSSNLLDLGHSADLRAVLDTNVTGLVLCSQWAYQSMVQRKVDGHIVHINSVAGHMVPNFPKLSIYPGTKHAVTAITETMRHELRAAGTKIKVTSVSPGAVKTEILNAADMPLDMPMLESEDISQAVLYAIGTPPRVQVHEIIIKPVGEAF